MWNLREEAKTPAQRFRNLATSLPHGSDNKAHIPLHYETQNKHLLYSHTSQYKLTYAGRSQRCSGGCNKI